MELALGYTGLADKVSAGTLTTSRIARPVDVLAVAASREATRMLELTLLTKYSYFDHGRRILFQVGVVDPTAAALTKPKTTTTPARASSPTSELQPEKLDDV